MTIRSATAKDLETWSALRLALWPDTTRDAHRAEAQALLAADHAAAFIATAPDDTPNGFAEVTLRHDHVNGCDTSPVAFLEGIYVIPSARGTGTARALVGAVTSWAKDQGCTELGSDTGLANTDSQQFHAAIGFAETERVIFFRKLL